MKTRKVALIRIASFNRQRWGMRTQKSPLSNLFLFNMVTVMGTLRDRTAPSTEIKIVTSSGLYRPSRINARTLRLILLIQLHKARVLAKMTAEVILRRIRTKGGSSARNSGLIQTKKTSTQNPFLILQMRTTHRQSTP